MKQSLFNIQKDYKEIISAVEFAEGEITDENSEALEINEKELQSKSIAYLEVMKMKEAVNGNIDEEIKRLQQMKKVNTNIATRLKQNLFQAVQTFGNFEVGLTKFGKRKGSTLIIKNVNDLPKEYKTAKITESANKIEIKKAIKRGEKIKGCELFESFTLKIN